MSIPTSFQGLRVNVTGGEMKTNKTQIQLPQPGDDNANQLTQGEGGVVGDTGYSTSSLPPLVSQSDAQDKLLIWGSEQRCMDPELQEFELLECHEIHTFLGKRDQEEEDDEEEDGGSVRDGKDEGLMSISSSSTASSASVGVRRNDNDSNKVESRIQGGKEMQRRMACHSSEDLDAYVTSSAEKGDTRSGRGRDRERRKGGLKESKSETNVFVSSLSAISLSGSLASALDSSGEAQSLISLSNPKTNLYPNANTTTSAQTRRRAPPVDANQNSPPLHPQEEHELEGHPQYYSQDRRQEDGGHHRNGLSSSDGGLGQRRKAGFEERVLPPRRQQLVRPLCQTEMGRGRSLPEPLINPHQTETVQTFSPAPYPDSQCHGTNRRCTRSSLREPSDVSHLYSTAGASQPRLPGQAAQREAQPLDKQPATARHTSSPSSPSSPSNPSTLEKRPQTQLTYRRNCSSPNRTGIVSSGSRASTPPHSPLRTPQGSPRRQPSMYLASRNVAGVVRHPQPGCSPAVQTSPQGYSNSGLRPPVRTNISTTGIPKAPLNNQQSPPNSNHSSSPKDRSLSPKYTPKPKGVRPKIITYVRKNPQFKPQAVDGPYQVSSLPSRLSAYTHSQTNPPNTPRDPSKPGVEPRGAPVLSASNLLYDKYRQEMQTNMFPSGMLSRNIRPPGHTHTVPPVHAHTAPHTHTHSHTAPPKLGSKADNFYGAMPSEMGRTASFGGSCADDPSRPRTAAQAGGSGSLLRSGRGLRLGLGAVTRTATGSAKARGPGQGQRSTLVFSQPVQSVSPATNQKSQDYTGKYPAPPPAPATAAAQPQAAASRSLLPKASQSQSGLRPPGFSSSRLPPGRLAAFGFVRSSSVSSVSSAHSADSTQSDPCRPGLSVSEEPPLHRVTTTPPSAEQQRGPPCRSSSLQPPSTPALPRRYLPAQPRNSPGGQCRKEFQRSSEVTRSLPSSPKRLAVVPPKPQSPVQSRQRPAAAVRGSVPPGSPRRVAPIRPQQEQQESLQREKEEAQQKERERETEEREKEEQREEVQRLQGRCEQQERQLSALRDELRKTTLGLEAFIVTTQQYCLKNKNTEEKERELSVEIQRIREELASNSMRWERLQREKTALEVAFERELQELQLQQEAELAAVEEGLRKCHSAETEHLRAEHRSVVEELRTQQQEQMEEMTVNHQAAIQELRDMHNITMATLHEEHARTMRDLRKAHEQQKMILEEDFEKLKLSLQDQVDTLTFQNQSLRDKAKRFEEALRRSTDEQIVDALAPYQHIEQDLKSLKEVVEMKNQQIHQQEKKISDLEKVQAQKNVFLEEKIQVLQQQNEDMKARIDMNLVLSRQLSEENANLQESVEKESTEKKRLSRNNEELLWRLQTSPLMSPSSSPLHRSFSTSPVPSSPFFSSSPVAGCDSPTHCYGCTQQASPAHYCSPSHRATANQNLSPGPATPTHRAASNQNYSPGPATPTHRASANHCNPAACLNPLQR
ncbi:microtubule-associated tumor suppressor candidate 2 homolog [Centroberyx gerrardi]